MKTADARLLAEFLESPERPDGTFRFHELQGFLFAVACSPETVLPSEWLPLIGDDESLEFANEQEAQTILGLVMSLYNEVNAAVLARSNALAAGCVFHENLSGNFEDDASISQWSRGFAAGHDWLSEVWDHYLFGELDEECAATLMVLSFFGSKQLAHAYHAGTKSGRHRKDAASFEDFANTMRRMFPDAMASYANIGRSIAEAILDSGQGGREAAVSRKVGRNEPCPCGSGKKYKRCCGGAMH